jgi:hypothetical protein
MELLDEYDDKQRLILMNQSSIKNYDNLIKQHTKLSKELNIPLDIVRNKLTLQKHHKDRIKLIELNKQHAFDCNNLKDRIINLFLEPESSMTFHQNGNED